VQKMTLANTATECDLGDLPTSYMSFF